MFYIDEQIQNVRPIPRDVLTHDGWVKATTVLYDRGGEPMSAQFPFPIATPAEAERHINRLNAQLPALASQS